MVKTVEFLHPIQAYFHATKNYPPMRSKTSRDSLHDQLLSHWGPVVGGEALAQALGFPTTSALRQSVARGQVSLALFTIPGRRGRFALTRDVADWLALQSSSGEKPDRQLPSQAPGTKTALKNIQRKGGRHDADVM